MTNQNPGCSGSLLKLFGIKPKYIEENEAEETADLIQEPNPFPYHQRDDFLSAAEHSFFMVARDVLGSHFVICPKVNLADLFFVERPHENMGAINKINRKHVDFVICHPRTMKPIFAIELDDRSHQRADRKARDIFVNHVFETADLPLLRVPVKSAYDTRELAMLFKSALQAQKRPENGTIETQSQGTVNFCPQCGSEMKLRTATKGKYAGRKFYGCVNYPKCKTIIPAASG